MSSEKEERVLEMETTIRGSLKRVRRKQRITVRKKEGGKEVTKEKMKIGRNEGNEKESKDRRKKGRNLRLMTQGRNS